MRDSLEYSPHLESSMDPDAILAAHPDWGSAEVYLKTLESDSECSGQQAWLTPNVIEYIMHRICPLHAQRISPEALLVACKSGFLDDVLQRLISRADSCNYILRMLNDWASALTGLQFLDAALPYSLLREQGKEIWQGRLSFMLGQERRYPPRTISVWCGQSALFVQMNAVASSPNIGGSG